MRHRKEVAQPEENVPDAPYEIALQVSGPALAAILAATSAEEIKAAVREMDVDWKAAIFTAVLQHRVDEESRNAHYRDGNVLVVVPEPDLEEDSETGTDPA